MLKVWGRRSSFNVQKVMWLVGELALVHRHVEAGGEFGGLDTPAFLAMNPHGRVPVIDDHGTVASTWWDDEQPSGYRPGGWFPIHRETIFHPGSLVTAIRRTAGHVDLFATDRDGIVRTIWWDEDEAGGYRPEGWAATHLEMRCPPGGPVPKRSLG